MKSSAINPERAVHLLMKLLSIEGPGGKEGQVAQFISQTLLQAGCNPEWIKTDNAHKQIGPDHEIGNLIIQLPGTVNAPRILFSAHMDTVPLCRGAEPVHQGDRIVSKGATGLGADDRTGCAAMLTLAEYLLTEQSPYPPTTFLFVIAEEGGLHGSRHVQFEDLGHPVMGFNLDGQEPNEIVIGAMSAARWTATVTGRSSHAGLEPHKGISAGLIAAKAMTAIAEKGFFGRIIQGDQKGTSNLGSIQGGEADNQVMDHLLLTGECRSHNPEFLEKIVAVYRECFYEAARSVTNDEGRCGSVDFQTTSSYRAFKLDLTEPCVQRASRAVELAGLTPNPLVMDAGLDANNFNEKGFPVVTLGAGAHNFHTIDEYVDIPEYQTACQVLLNIITLSAAAS
jgi:tripeptide aminopeptidase